jgi:phosphoglucosamine mutase
MQEAVLLHQADIGIALDGDADRLIMADENGHRIDGDQLMSLIAQHWKHLGKLRGDGVVATVMSNLGMERYLSKQNIKLHRTPVGDRYVVEGMKTHGCNLGGEQSGHIVLSDYNTTGDGLVAALQILAAIREKKGKASEVCNLFKRVPQILTNVKAPASVLEKTSIQNAISKAEKSLNGSGRLVIRKSGTEPLIRVMAEGDDEKLVQTLVNDIINAISNEAA